MYAFELVRSIIVNINSYDYVHPYNSSFIVFVALSNYDYSLSLGCSQKGSNNVGVGCVQRGQYLVIPASRYYKWMSAQYVDTTSIDVNHHLTSEDIGSM